jgi:hypothetical protein
MIDIIVRTKMANVAEVIIKALERSFTRGQLRVGDGPAELPRGGIVIVLGPAAIDAEWLQSLVHKPCKIVLLGALPQEIAALAGIKLNPVDAGLAHSEKCRPASTHTVSESDAAIVYAASGLGAFSPLRRRSFCRFDFTDEWNNQGFGRTSAGDDPWSIAVTAQTTNAAIVAEIAFRDQIGVGAIATVRDTSTASILWFSRPVGPVDGPDWRIMESFLSDYRHPELPCRPHLRDIPHGFAGAATMRLDCDEAIASARPLLDLYSARRQSLSVAVKTGQPADLADIVLLADVKSAGGSILSHSVTHPMKWGGTAAATEIEARTSKMWLETQVPGLIVRYAISPFHQNPTYVPETLARVGYQGFIGGTISNDPEYLMARGGAVPYGPRGFVSHSQSCMLHGDCMLTDGDPMRVYRGAFQTARLGGQFFAFLDHPFSERYSYGWTNEQDRLTKHSSFLDFMAADCAAAGGALLFVNEDTCLNFMREKSATEIMFDENRQRFDISRHLAAGLPLSIGFCGTTRAAGDV